MNNTTGKVFAYVFLFAIGVWYTMLNYCAIPRADDLLYLCAVGVAENGEMNFLPHVNGGLSETLHSMVNLRYLHNSRLGNALYILFANTGGLRAVEIVNGLSFVAFLFGSCFYCLRKFSLKSLLVILILFFLCVKVWPRTCMWHVAGIAYMVGNTFLVCVLLLLRRVNSGGASRYVIVALLVSSFIASCLHEGLGIPLFCSAFFCVMYRCLHEHRLPHMIEILPLVSIACALMWHISSPGLGQRVSGEHSSSFLQKLPEILFFVVPQIWPAVVVMIWTGLRLKVRLLEEPVSYFIVFSLPFALLFKSGEWGGGSHYFCTGVMLLAGIALRDCKWLQYKYAPLTLWSLVLVLIGYYALDFSRLHSLHRDWIAACRNGGIVNFTLPYDGAYFDVSTFTCSCYPASNRYIDLALKRLYNIPPSQMVFAWDTADPQFLKRIPHTSTDEPIWYKSGRFSYVKLPHHLSLGRGTSLVLKSPHVVSSPHHEYALVEKLQAVRYEYFLRYLRDQIYTSYVYYEGNLFFWFESDDEEINKMKIVLMRGKADVVKECILTPTPLP